MHYQIKIVELGDSAGFILPDEMVAALNVKAGDSLRLSVEPDGWLLTAEKPDVPDRNSTKD
jgi:antitoxin component of MazEF toxin-antitoxin module